MDLLKTPSIQSLLDSDLESVESLHYIDFEELDEVEYALPASEAPTLAEALSAEDGGFDDNNDKNKMVKESVTCSALQVEFLQAISQQLTQAQERSLAGAATALSVGSTGKTTVGTAHGHILSFQDQTLRWVCDANENCGAVTCLAYNNDSTRLLAGYARGLIFQYESVRGVILRRVTLGGETWGALRVTWAGTSGLALDTGGSVWLMKFSRPLGVRSARVSCLFSGARGEVVVMSARDARILALATLSRVIIVAGGRAAGVRLEGPPDTLPVLEWCETDNRILVCARFNTLQWLSIDITGTSIVLRPVQKVELNATPLWMGWLGGSLAIFDSNENLRLWGDDNDKPLDLSNIEPVYSSAFFKGLWTDGRVSLAMCKAGESALAGICVAEGALSILGRKGIMRVRPRDILARTRAFVSSGRHLQALRLLCAAQDPNAKTVATDLVHMLAERPHILSNKNVAVQTIKLCLKFELIEELWSNLWENCSSEKAFVEALGDAIVRGEFSAAPPSPDYTQALIERLAEFEPELVERVVASVPLTALDPHRASVFTREKGLWRGVGAIAAAIDGSSGAMRTLSAYVSSACEARAGGRCSCAGGALLLAAADALAGRGAAGRPLPEHARPLARHDALHALLHDVLPIEELWSNLWENCSSEKAFVEALGDAIVRGEFSAAPPSPDYTQALIERLAEFEPELVERVVASVPLTALDPHRASVFTREKGLWRGVGAIAAAIDGSSGAMRTLSAYVSSACEARAGGRCSCAGGALLRAAADALAGRGAAGRPLPEHARPLARHDALHALLHDVSHKYGLCIFKAECSPLIVTAEPIPAVEPRKWMGSGESPLAVLVRHEAAAAVRLLEQGARDPPFAGPLAKQNRLRVARALLALALASPPEPDVQDPACQIEILDFISGQLQSGALPLDQEVVSGVRQLAAAAEGERADRAWLGVVTRLRAQRDHALAVYRDAIPRPRVLWRFDVLLDRHDNVLREFFKIEHPSSLDLDELIEYIRSRFQADDAIKTRLQPYLKSLIELRPQASAAIVKDHYETSIANILSTLEGECALEFGRRLLDMASLKGDAAAIYLRRLCTLRPTEVKKFLENGAGVVRPEDALAIIKELGPKEAEPACLEATGDPSGALDAMLDLISSNDNTKAARIAEACELCVRVAPSAPPDVSAEMWTRLLRRVDEVPPSLLFEAIAYLPVDELLVKTCDSPKVALTILESGAGRLRVWECAKRIAEQECHGALASALAKARRGLAVRGDCLQCGERLVSRMAARSAHCSRAVHADCDGQTVCTTCGKSIPTEVYVLPPLGRRLFSSIPQDNPLLLTAPPRPDLEGVA
ncbi:Vacuolar protein sorting-associated protein 8-like [Papilio machaon]|uniref:Vacuolar protein sorting-associated protein 8-like n=1 Tax=Papilio machaon TaxID=76193 RepID=A0A194QUF6_PAPMA|nr:Vacuolar protein sorting-associated protein 8-like [Papilio machaon]